MQRTRPLFFAFVSTMKVVGKTQSGIKALMQDPSANDRRFDGPLAKEVSRPVCSLAIAMEHR